MLIGSEYPREMDSEKSTLRNIMEFLNFRNKGKYSGWPGKKIVHLQCEKTGLASYFIQCQKTVQLPLSSTKMLKETKLDPVIFTSIQTVQA